jgi:pimeloyl-ACP methyl ester carboxylesterase
MQGMKQAPARPAAEVTSRDGTRIAYERFGDRRDRPAVILVLGAFNDRGTGRPLAEHLAADFTVYTYDRRGRGESDDTAPYAVEREIEDLEALIAQAGGEAAVFGFSSGAILALKAARVLAITRLALYDAPFDVDGQRPRPTVSHVERLWELMAAGKRGEAVEYFQGEMVGLPPEVVAQLRHAPFRPWLEAMAHTLVYEATILGDGSLPADEVAAVGMPTLAIDGGDFGGGAMRRAAEAVAAAVRDGRHLSLGEQQHQIVPEVIGRPLREFFAAEASHSARNIRCRSGLQADDTSAPAGPPDAERPSREMPAGEPVPRRPLYRRERRANRR